MADFLGLGLDLDFWGVISTVIVMFFWLIVIVGVPLLLWLFLSFSYDVKVFKEYENGFKIISDRAKLKRVKGSNAKCVKFLFHKDWDVSQDLMKYSVSKGGLAMIFPVFGFNMVFLRQDKNGNFHHIRPPNSGELFTTIPHDNLLWLTNRNVQIMQDNTEKKAMLLQALPYAGFFILTVAILGGLLLIEDNVNKAIELGNQVMQKSVELARPTIPPSETMQQSQPEQTEGNSAVSDFAKSIVGD